MESLASCNGFGDTHLTERFNAVQTSMNQIMHQLTLLTKTWKDVLPLDLCEKSIGFLLDAVLDKVILYVEKLNDISVDETDKLYALVSILFKSEHLFQSKDEQRVK